MKRTNNTSEPSPSAAHLSPTMLLSLQAFDAAIRLGSFKAAAKALRVTPSAVSHRIRKLEKSIGERLFDRRYQEVLPTKAGQDLAARTGRAFADLARAAAVDENRKYQIRRLRVSIAPLFATAWLIPRLPEFMRQHPDVELSIESTSRLIDFNHEPIDAAIRVGEGAWPGLDAHPLMQLYFVPVAAPTLARGLALDEPNDLLKAPLIHIGGYPRAWRAWFKHAGVAAKEPPCAVRVDSFDAALQAAEQGIGIALGPEPLFAERETSGRLRRMQPQRLPGPRCWLVHRADEPEYPALRAFKRWLLSALPTSNE